MEDSKMSGGEGCTVFVRGYLPSPKKSKKEPDLLQLLGPAGFILDLVLLKDEEGRSKGAAIVTFSSAREAQEAIRCFHGYTFDGSPRPITVSLKQGGRGQKRGSSAGCSGPASKAARV